MGLEDGSEAFRGLMDYERAGFHMNHIWGEGAPMELLDDDRFAEIVQTAIVLTNGIAGPLKALLNVHQTQGVEWLEHFWNNLEAAEGTYLDELQMVCCELLHKYIAFQNDIRGLLIELVRISEVELQRRNGLYN